MPVDFFVSPCNNPNGNCQTEVVQCLQDLSSDSFGISDANANSGIHIPAKVMFDNPSQWDFQINNPGRRLLQYKAIDYCVDIFRTGAYDVSDDEREINDFSSDNTDTRGRGLIKRCEGLLMQRNRFVLFFEIKKGLYKGWLIDARRKFEETILSFKENHPQFSHLIIDPIVSNKTVYKVHQTEAVQKKILKEKTGVALKVETFFDVP